MDDNNPCLCGSNLSYNDCCGHYHAGAKAPTTAVVLMRSRFTAFAMKNAGYLLDTWAATTRPKKIDFADDSTDWLRLEIVNCKKGGVNDSKGVVEFKAFYQLGDKQRAMREISRFRKLQGRWFYLDGVVKSIANANEETGKGHRNAPCPCGSGKKYKRCCGAK